MSPDELRDWEALIGRHTSDLRRSLAGPDVLRLRLVSSSLRRAFGQAVDVLHVPWPPAFALPLSPFWPAAPSATAAAASAVQPLLLERPGSVFPSASQIHIHLDILSLATEPHLAVGIQETEAVAAAPPTPPTPLAAAAAAAAAATMRPAPSAAQGESRDYNYCSRDRARDGDSSKAVTDSGRWGSGDPGSGGGGGCGGQAAVRIRALDGIRLSARLSLRLQFGGRVMAAAEQQRLEARVRALTERLLAARQPHLNPDQDPDPDQDPYSGRPQGRVSEDPSLDRAPGPGASAQSAGWGGPTSPMPAPDLDPWVTWISLPASLTRLHLDLEVQGGEEEEVLCITPGPAALSAALLRLPQLRDLALGWSRIQGGHLAAVVGMSGLRSLSLVDHYDGPDGWLGACRAAVSFALPYTPGAPEGPKGPLAGRDAADDVVGGAERSTQPVASSAAATIFATAFDIPMESLPRDWTPGLLAVPKWLNVVQQLRLASPAFSAHGLPPWLMAPGQAPQAPPLLLPLVQPWYRETWGRAGSGTSHPAAAAAAAAAEGRGISAPPLGCLTLLEVGGLKPPRRWREPRPLLSPGLLLPRLADSQAAAAAAACGAGGGEPNPACWEHGRAGAGSSRVEPVKGLPLGTHGSVGPPPTRPAARPWGVLAALSFQAQSMQEGDWAALCALSGLRELRINGWRLGAALSSPLVLEEELEGQYDDLTEDGEQTDGQTDGEADGEYSLHTEGPGAGVGAGVSAPGAGSVKEGLLSLPRLRLLMLSLRRGAQLRRVLGELPLLEALHLAVRGADAELSYMALQPPPYRPPAGELDPCIRQQSQHQHYPEGGGGGGRLAAEARAANRARQAAATAAALAAWRPLLRCSRLVEVNITTGLAAEMPLTDGLAAGHLAAAWPRLTALQYSAGQWDGLGGTHAVAVAAFDCSRKLAVAASTAAADAAPAPATTSVTDGQQQPEGIDVKDAFSGSSSGSVRGTTGDTPPVGDGHHDGDGVALAPSDAADAAVAPPTRCPALPWSNLQVLSLGSTHPRSASHWIAPTPLQLEELPPGLRVLSLMGLQLRGADLAGGDAVAGGPPPGPAPAPLPLLPLGLTLLSVKCCSWQVPGLSLLQAISSCPGLLELRLAWAVDDPPYIVRQYRPGPGDAGQGGADADAGPASSASPTGATPPVHAPVSSEEEQRQWAHLAVSLSSLERLELTCWPPTPNSAPAGPDGQSSAASEVEGEEEDQQVVHAGRGPGGETESSGDFGQQQEQHQHQETEQEKAQELPSQQRHGQLHPEEQEAVAGEESEPQQPKPAMPPAADEPEYDDAVVLAGCPASEASLASLFSGVAHLRELQSLQWSAQVLGGWGSQVDWTVLSRMTGLVKLTLYGLSRGSADRVLKIAGSALPLCRSSLHVDNTSDLLEQLRHADMLLTALDGALPGSASPSTSGSLEPETEPEPASSPSVTATALEGTAAGPSGAGNHVSDGSGGDNSAHELDELGEVSDEELLDELLQLELQIEAEAGGLGQQPLH